MYEFFVLELNNTQKFILKNLLYQFVGGLIVNWLDY